MEQINTIALADLALYPDTALLQEELGDSFKTYQDAFKSLALSPARIVLILSAKNVGKSMPATFDIKDSSMLDDFETIIKYKLSIL
jgi:hypothetical protein